MDTYIQVHLRCLRLLSYGEAATENARALGKAVEAGGCCAVRSPAIDSPTGFRI
jgi:hypothetical protein